MVWLLDRRPSCLVERVCLCLSDRLPVCSGVHGRRGRRTSACHRCALSRSVTCGWRDRRWTCLFLDCGGPGPRVTYQKVIIPVACHVEGRRSTAWDAGFVGSVGRLLEDEVSERRGGRKGRQALGCLAVGQGGMMMDPGLGQDSLAAVGRPGGMDGPGSGLASLLPCRVR